MHWLNKIVDELITRHPEGEIIVSSGVSPSGTYHLGTLREVLTAEVITLELNRRGRTARHLHIVDDLDVFRKVPANVPAEFEQYLGRPLSDIPAPDGSQQSYADYFLADLLTASHTMKLKMDVVRAHEKYRSGFFKPAIEKSLEHLADIRQILSDVSGSKLDENWSPIQVIEDGYLKTRQFKSIDASRGVIVYIDQHGQEQQTGYAGGEVKLNWRIDWPARWWLLNVQAEPFGRDHATKGGSYDTGELIVRKVFSAEPPLPVPYHFINRTGETKKMSKSAGNVITASQLLQILPSEIVWYFILRSSPDKQLFFDEGETLMKLFDDYAELLVKPGKTDQENQLLELTLNGVDQSTASNIPFSHLVACYQASLKDPSRTLELIKRTEHADVAERDSNTIRRELTFIDNWLAQSAPEEIKFDLNEKVEASDFSGQDKQFLSSLADKISEAPADADGEWFHGRIYELKDSLNIEPKLLFQVLYRVLIGKNSGPRAGWFLSVLDRNWLIKRLRLEA